MGELYAVRSDFSACFDRISQEELLGILRNLLDAAPAVFWLHKFNVLSEGRRGLRRRFHYAAWPDADGSPYSSADALYPSHSTDSYS